MIGAKCFFLVVAVVLAMVLTLAGSFFCEGRHGETQNM